jgi:hypothetical protein
MDVIEGKHGIDGVLCSSGLLLQPVAAANTAGLALLRPSMSTFTRATNCASKLPFGLTAAAAEGETGRTLLLLLSLLLGMLRGGRLLLLLLLLGCSCHEMRAARCLLRCCKLLLRVAGTELLP